MGSESSKQSGRDSLPTPKPCESSNNRLFPPSIHISNSISCADDLLKSEFTKIRRNSSSGHSLSNGQNRTRSGSTCSRRSVDSRRHPLSVRERQLIQSCFQNHHEIVGRKITKRAAERRQEFGQFYAKLEVQQREEFEESIKVLLKKAVANIDFIDEVKRLAEEFGARHATLRNQGFKPDFFAACADATITECVFLDNAVHPAVQTLNAFTSFISLLFSSVRDGFYNEMKRIRRSSNSFNIGSNSSFRRSNAQDTFENRCVSPANDSDDSNDCTILPATTVNYARALLAPPSTGSPQTTRSC